MKNFSTVWPASGSSFQELVAECVGVAAMTRAARQYQYLLGHYDWFGYYRVNYMMTGIRRGCGL